VVIGYSGNLEIELITSTAEENIYVNFLRENGPGLHHINYFVSNLDKAVQDYQDIGFELVQNGTMGNKSVVTRYAYLRPPNSRYGNIVELQQTRMFDIFTIYRNSFLTWAGTLMGGAERIKLSGL
jgi:hypothetical protein